MLYTLLSGVFLTLFLFIGAWSFFGFVDEHVALENNPDHPF